MSKSIERKFLIKAKLCGLSDAGAKRMIENAGAEKSLATLRYRRMDETQEELKREVRLELKNLMFKNPVFIDTETTGLGFGDEVCQIAVIDCSGIVLLDSLVNPSIPIKEEAASVHGISNESVELAPTFQEVEPELTRITQHRVVATYNLDFDLRVINQTLRHYCLGKFKYDAGFCIMKAYAKYHGEMMNETNFKYQKLENAMRQMGINFDGKKHTALADADMARRLVIAVAFSS